MDPKYQNKPSRAKARDVVSELRNRIIAGPWSPGTRIPTKLELSEELGASAGTVQKALDFLTAHEFLRSRGHLGTFIVDHPPHLHRIGLVTDFPRSGSIWFKALETVAEKLTREGHDWLHIYADCHRDPGGASPGMQELENDIRQARLAGLILSCHPDTLAGAVAQQQPGLAQVILSSNATACGFPAVHFRPAYPRAMQYFQERGRQRLAIITTFHHDAVSLEPLLQCARNHGLQTSPLWMHRVGEHEPHPARSIAALLMSLPAKKRPDALYIHDDHLVHETTEGVAEAGVRVPGEITIIAHANFPAVQPVAVPVTYLGYDMTVLLRAALELLNQQLAGKRVADITWADPVFDYELPGACG